MIDFWIREQSSRMLEFAYNSSTYMRPYGQTYLTGDMDDPVPPPRVGDFFTLASWELWKPEKVGPEYDFAHVRKAALYPGGVVFTPFKANANDCKTSNRQLLMHMKDRIELVGSDGEDFPSRFFKTHIGSFKTQEAKDWHAFLYRSGVGKFIVDVPGSFPIAEVDGLLMKEGVLTDEGVSGSKYMGIISINDRKVLFSNWAHCMDESSQNMPGYIDALVRRNEDS